MDERLKMDMVCKCCGWRSGRHNAIQGWCPAGPVDHPSSEFWDKSKTFMPSTLLRTQERETQHNAPLSQAMLNGEVAHAAPRWNHIQMDGKMETYRGQAHKNVYFDEAASMKALSALPPARSPRYEGKYDAGGRVPLPGWNQRTPFDTFKDSGITVEYAELMLDGNLYTIDRADDKPEPVHPLQRFR